MLTLLSSPSAVGGSSFSVTGSGVVVVVVVLVLVVEAGVLAMETFLKGSAASAELSRPNNSTDHIKTRKKYVKLWLVFLCLIA